jgi:hypothetical protein
VYQEKNISTPKIKNGSSDSNWEDITVEETQGGIDKALLLWEMSAYSPSIDKP